MAGSELEARDDWLRTLDVPAQFRGQICEVPRSRLIAVAAFVMVALPIGLMIAAMLWLQSTAQAGAERLAAETGSTLVYVNVGVGPLLMLFGLIFLSMTLVYVYALRHQSFAYAAAMISEPPQQTMVRSISAYFMRGSVHRAAQQAGDAQGFMSAYLRDQIRLWGTCAAALLLPALVITVLETRNYWVAGPAGIFEQRLFQPFTRNHHALNAAKELATGCNNTSRANHLIYDVTFPSGTSFDLGDAEQVKNGDIARLEVVDQSIAPTVPHTRWSHLHRDPLHPACLDYWSGRFDANGSARLAKLLRIGPI